MNKKTVIICVVAALCGLGVRFGMNALKGNNPVFDGGSIRISDDDDDDAGILEDDEDDIGGDNEVAEIEQTEKKLAASKSRLVNNDKESSVDDPIRYYLREIGRENLLTAEQEVILSKQMEDGKNIIKDVIRNAGIMIPEFFAIAQKAFTRSDVH